MRRYCLRKSGSRHRAPASPSPSFGSPARFVSRRISVSAFLAVVSLVSACGIGGARSDVRDGRKPLPEDRSFAYLFGPNTSYAYFENAAEHPFLHRAEGFEMRNAWWLADASLLAYVTDERFIRARLSEAGLGEIKLVASEEQETHDTQCFIASNEDFVIVAFRGTEPDEPRDLLTDILFFPGESSGGEGKVHTGFNDALDEVWGEIETYLDEIRDSDQTVWFTGHSLGAALALLAAARYDDPAGVYTFGCPRVGDVRFGDRYPTQVFRFVNNVDLVTELPPPGLYRHVGELKYFDRNNRLQDTLAKTDMIEDQFAARLKRIGVVMSDWSNLEFNRVALKDMEDHAPIYYAIHCWNNYVGEQ